jgi:hypothetical protein
VRFTGNVRAGFAVVLADMCLTDITVCETWKFLALKLGLVVSCCNRVAAESEIGSDLIVNS